MNRFDSDHNSLWSM